MRGGMAGRKEDEMRAGEGRACEVKGREGEEQGEGGKGQET